MNRRFLIFWIAPLALLLAAAIAPLASGARTLFLRDVLNTHLGMRAFLADSLRHGELPLVDPLRAGGQVLVGNPNVVPLYPDNLLLLVASTLWQLNAHFWLHGLVALGAMYWLARVVGLGREPALVSGAVYALSGYLLSQMNLYNAVAGAALAPALAAALLAAAEPVRRAKSLAGFALLWALELVAGDPVLAILALAVALGLGLGSRREIPWWGATLALGSGTLLAAPQWVELLRQVPTSFRGFWGNSATSQLGASPDPRGLADLLLPFFFGRPDLQQGWGRSYFGGAEPLYYSLAPGVLALALAAVALRRPARSERATALLFVAGALLTFSGGAVGWFLAHLPGGQLFRFSVKFALFGAVAGSLLAGRGFERAGEDPDARRRLERVLVLAAALFGALTLFFSRPGNWFEVPFRAVLGPGLDDHNFASYRQGWAVAAVLQLVLALAFLGLMRLRRRWPDLAGGLVVSLHAAAQLVLLAPMLPTDDAARYRSPPPVANRLPADAVLAHGAVHYLFGSEPYHLPRGSDRRLVHVARRAQGELFQFAGALAGRRYEFACSPEGLDSFMVHAVAIAMRQMSDAERLYILRATGVDRLLLSRALSAEAQSQVELVERVDTDTPLFLYRPLDALGEVQLLGNVRFVSNMTAAVVEVTRGRLVSDTALLAGEGEARTGPPGRAEIVANEVERVRVEIDSPAGGALVVRRAWLPHWRAAIDGRPAPTVVANLTRLAVEVPPGRRTVELWIDRTPFRLAWGGTALGLLGLVALARSRGRASKPA